MRSTALASSGSTVRTVTSTSLTGATSRPGASWDQRIFRERSWLVREYPPEAAAFDVPTDRWHHRHADPLAPDAIDVGCRLLVTDS